MKATADMNTAYRAGCSITDCSRPHQARGWCKLHYYRWHRTGDPNGLNGRPPGRLVGEEALRWNGWTVTDSGCWEWNGTCHPKSGYGRVGVTGRKVPAHRLAYETWVGPIADGLIIRHFVCDNPPCINPAHLRPGTQTDNMRDMKLRGRERKAIGEANASAKLTSDDVRAIRALASQGRTGTALAAMYGISGASARSVINRKTWKHIE